MITGIFNLNVLSEDSTFFFKKQQVNIIFLYTDWDEYCEQANYTLQSEYYFLYMMSRSGDCIALA